MTGAEIVRGLDEEDAAMLRRVRLLALGCAAVAVVLGVLLSYGCSSVPIVREVPKPVRTIVERAACDQAAAQIPDVNARALFIASCYQAADLWGAHHVEADAGADAGAE